MKTNQVLVREMGEFDVCQRTSDRMFNATSLLQQWNVKNPSEKRDMDNFWKSTHLNKLMIEIIRNEPDLSSVKIKDDEKSKTVNSTDYKNTLDFKELKKATSKTTKGKSGATWMHPILFIKFAMYLSPSFEYHVLKFVSDQLLKYRNDADDAYKEMSASIAQLVEKPLMQAAMKDVAKALNYIVYNNHEPMMRNKKADESLLCEMVELEKDIVKLVHFGFVKTYEALKSYLRERWREKWQPKVLSA